jgi:hypothetical protein
MPALLTADARNVAQTIHPSKRYYGALEHGGYAFSPYEVENLKYQKYRYVSTHNDFYEPDAEPGFTEAVPMYYINTVPISVLYFDDKDTTSGSQLAIRAELHLEFRTDSPLFDISSTIGIESDLLLAQQIMANLPYFYENPSHFARIRDLVNRLWRRMRPYAPALIRAGGTALSGAFPEAGPVPGYAAQILAGLIE